MNEREKKRKCKREDCKFEAAGLSNYCEEHRDRILVLPGDKRYLTKFDTLFVSSKNTGSGSGHNDY